MKVLEISKELIKAVLQKETETLSKDFDFTINEDYIEFSDDGEVLFEYCIYKFAFKCKEWLSSNIKKINKNIDNSIYSGEGFCKINPDGGDGNGVYWYYEFYSDTEVEAIIKACEWAIKAINK